MFDLLSRPFLDALWREAKAIRTGGAVPTVIKGIEKLAAARSGVNSGKVVENILSLSQYLQRSGKSAGLLLVVDELGKFLEYAARDPEQGDVFVLQQLAEAASDTKTGLVLVMVMHQAFENYAASPQARCSCGVGEDSRSFHGCGVSRFG